jgi:ubiquinone/menaquinone biosynthesis C-methylase UbiE
MSDLDLLLRRENVHRLLRPLLAKRQTRLRVLDVGCGSGDVLDGLDRDGLSVIGVDRVPTMLAQAARTHPADRFIVADATRLPISDSSVDLITCLGVLEYIPDYEAALASFFDKLRPGGYLIVSFPNRRSLFRSLSVVEGYVEAKALRLRDLFRGRRRPVEAGPAYDHRQWSLPEVHERLTHSGFEVADVLFNTFGVWGHVGQLRLMLHLSEYLTNHLCRRPLVSSWLACTMVALARKAKAR